MLYINRLDNTLWRSRPDGTERLQLTASMDDIEDPRWSPDGRHIAFSGYIRKLRKPGSIYVISADGGSPQQLIPEDRFQFSQSWSPDK
jgi:Tol biopolymer transport system component